MTLTEIRDDLLKTSEYKNKPEELAYANGVMDLFNILKKHTSPTMAKVKK